MEEPQVPANAAERRLKLDSGRELIWRTWVDTDGVEQLAFYSDEKFVLTGPRREMEQVFMQVLKEREAARTEQPEGWPFD